MTYLRRRSGDDTHTDRQTDRPIHFHSSAPFGPDLDESLTFRQQTVLDPTHLEKQETWGIKNMKS
jgi:hypothetical protein